MTIKEVISKGTDFLRNKGIETARLDVELLLSHVLKCTRVDLYLKFDKPMLEDEIVVARGLVQKRGQGEPVAYLTGSTSFYGHDFVVRPGVLVPRQDTETLIDEALALTKGNVTAPEICDFGSGSGCIGIALAKELPDAKVTLVELSEKAFAICNENIEINEVSDRVGAKHTSVDQFQTDKRFDLIAANPPYIDREDPHLQDSVRLHEPDEALFSGEEGYADIFKWSEKAFDLLKPGGYFLCEIGFEQADRVRSHFESKFEDIRVVKDLTNKDRVVIGRKGVDNG